MLRSKKADPTKRSKELHLITIFLISGRIHKFFSLLLLFSFLFFLELFILKRLISFSEHIFYCAINFIYWIGVVHHFHILPLFAPPLSCGHSPKKSIFNSMGWEQFKLCFLFIDCYSKMQWRLKICYYWKLFFV